MEAIAAARAAGKGEPGNAKGHAALGFALQHTGDWPGAGRGRPARPEMASGAPAGTGRAAPRPVER
ncbi:MAG: hypothetical protein J0I06_14615 [Planctomycetes bacterium]|nr:hypothetical protein [Planctomycetota bacterium]